MGRFTKPQVDCVVSLVGHILACTLGAYVLTALVTVLASRLLVQAGVEKVEAVIASTLASFAVFAVISMAAFHGRCVLRTWLWLCGASLVCFIGIHLLKS